MAIPVKPVDVRCAANEIARFCKFVMLNLKTMDLPLAADVAPDVAPPRTARADGLVATVDILPVAFRGVPARPLISVLVLPVAGTKKLLEPLLPSRYREPEPKLATKTFGVAGDTRMAVPPLVVVWKSHRATIAAFAALAAIIAQVPAARRVIVFMFFILSVLSIV